MRKKTTNEVSKLKIENGKLKNAVSKADKMRLELFEIINNMEAEAINKFDDEKNDVKTEAFIVAIQEHLKLEKNLKAEVDATRDENNWVFEKKQGLNKRSCNA